jgi:hypothetical protein
VGKTNPPGSSVSTGRGRYVPKGKNELEKVKRNFKYTQKTSKISRKLLEKFIKHQTKTPYRRK